MSQPLARLLSHRGPVTAAAVDGEGRYLVTAGLDCQCRVWDVRTFKPVHSYFTAAPAVSLDVSQRGLLAVAYSGRVQASRAVGTNQAGCDESRGRAPFVFMCCF